MHTVQTISPDDPLYAVYAQLALLYVDEFRAGTATLPVKRSSENSDTYSVAIDSSAQADGVVHVRVRVSNVQSAVSSMMRVIRYRHESLGLSLSGIIKP